jgi:hypothetical protein
MVGMALGASRAPPGSRRRRAYLLRNRAPLRAESSVDQREPRTRRLPGGYLVRGGARPRRKVGPASGYSARAVRPSTCVFTVESVVRAVPRSAKQQSGRQRNCDFPSTRDAVARGIALARKRDNDRRSLRRGRGPISLPQRLSRIGRTDSSYATLGLEQPTLPTECRARVGDTGVATACGVSAPRRQTRAVFVSGVYAAAMASDSAASTCFEPWSTHVRTLEPDVMVT